MDEGLLSKAQMKDDYRVAREVGSTGDERRREVNTANNTSTLLIQLSINKDLHLLNRTQRLVLFA